MAINPQPLEGDSDYLLLAKLALNVYNSTVGQPITLDSDPARNTFNQDAFHRQRISIPESLFDYKQIVDYTADFWDDTQVSGGGTSSTYSSDRASMTLAVSNVTAGRRTRQTKAYFNYKPGNSQMVFTSFVLGTAATGITRRTGSFDDANGFFLEQTSAGLRFVARSSVTGSPVDTVMSQASWSEDPMNGSGPSGVTLDPTKAQLFFLDFTWLGTGTVRFGFFIDGVPVTAHKYHTANLLTSVSIGSPNGPIRYELINSGAGPVASFETICSSVITEGGPRRIGASYAMDRDIIPLVTLNNTSVYPLLGIRYRSGDRPRSITVMVEAFSLLTTTANSYRWSLVKNPVFVGTAPVYSTISPVIEGFNTTLNATTITGGRTLVSGYGSQAASSGALPILFNLPVGERLGATYAGVSDVYVLGLQKLVGGTETFYAGLNWTEIP